MNQRDERQPEARPTTGPVLVPLANEREGEAIYSPNILRLAGGGALIGALLLAVVGYLVASGRAPLPHTGPFAAGGTAPAVFVAAGLGLALGALVGGLIAVNRLPKREMPH